MISSRSKNTKDTTPTGGRLGRRLGMSVAALAVIGAAILFGPNLSARVAGYLATRSLQSASIGTAQAWLDWAAWCDPSDGETYLAQAFCLRHLERVADWDKRLRLAADNGVAESRIQHEVRLQLTQSGVLSDGAEIELLASAAHSFTEYDVPSMLVYGYLAKRQYDRAERVLNAWGANYPDDSHVAYMWSRYSESRGDTARSRQFLETAMSLEPRHQLAALAMAQSWEEHNQLVAALQTYVELASALPANETLALGVARVLRKLGHSEASRAVLHRFSAKPAPSPDLAAAMGQLDAEAGSYSAAQQWLLQADLERTANVDLIASAFALDGKSELAQRYFAAATQERNRFVRSHDLQVRLAINPNDSSAIAELQRLGQPTSATPIGDSIRDSIGGQNRISTGSELYSLHCSSCHGVSGAGDGISARHLYPPPRNLRQEPSRLVSTVNGVPTIDDLTLVIRNGMPGTSMPPFPQLSDQQVEDLVLEVRRLRGAGLEEEFVQLFDGETRDEQEVTDFVSNRTTPGEVIDMPTVAGATSESLKNGQTLFVAVGCASCHGADGSGSPTATWYDMRQLPVRPRDLVREPMKGGADVPALYRRIALGMPGTPHPASPSLRPAQILDLVHYCRSLSQEPKRTRTNFERAAIATSDAYFAEREQ